MRPAGRRSENRNAAQSPELNRSARTASPLGGADGNGGLGLRLGGFCSASEAALFFAQWPPASEIGVGPAAGPRILLLEDPDRLLTAVLFWNLIVNLAYFAIASMISLRLERSGSSAAAAAMAFGSLLVLILFGEMLPKSVGVLMPGPLAGLLAVPLAGLVRLLAPVLPALADRKPAFAAVVLPEIQGGTTPSHRRFGARGAFHAERGFARAGATRAPEHRRGLSEIRVDELMRPRDSCRTFRPPVVLADLKGQMPSSGYLLVTEPDSEEIAKAIPLKSLSRVPSEHLEDHAEAVVYVPWCTTVADALEVMFRGPWRGGCDQRVRETIGILTEDDVLDTIFSKASSRVERILSRQPLRRSVRTGGTWTA